MKRRSLIIIIIIMMLVITAFTIDNYLISIYEVNYELTPKSLYADGESEITISAIPINGIGHKAFFRETAAEYTIMEGDHLVDIIKYDKRKGILILRAKNSGGRLKLNAKSPYALLPSSLSIIIHPNVVEVLH